MTESTEQKVQQKSTQKSKKNNNSGTSYSNLHITFSHDRYFATNFLLAYVSRQQCYVDQIQTVHSSNLLYQCYVSETISLKSDLQQNLTN